jgi:hypothetical protein
MKDINKFHGPGPALKNLPGGAPQHLLSLF